MRKKIMYSSLVHDEELTDCEGPLLVAGGTLGNRRFGSLVKTLRERRGLSVQELAEQVGVHASFVRGIERGAQAPSLATAHPLLASIKGQHRIQWMDDGPYDLLVSDPGTGRDVAFEFKAKVKGQNRRAEVGLDGAKAGLKLLAAVTQQLRRELGIRNPDGEIRESQEDVVRHAGEGQPRWSTIADDAAFGRVVRLLASADEETLTLVESLLRNDLSAGPTGS
ncbi:MAG: helix-turn-helix transcriptional regulator [Ilumatobacteraceae bacterium]